MAPVSVVSSREKRLLVFGRSARATHLSQPNRALRGRRIDDPTPLRHLDHAARDEPARRRARRFHEGPPIVFARQAPRCVRGTDRRSRCALREQREDDVLHLLIAPPAALAPATLAAIPDLVPVTFPLLPPDHAATTRRTGLLGKGALVHGLKVAATTEAASSARRDRRASEGRPRRLREHHLRRETRAGAAAYAGSVRSIPGGTGKYSPLGPMAWPAGMGIPSSSMLNEVAGKRSDSRRRSIVAGTKG